MNIKLEIDETDLQALVLDHLRSKLAYCNLTLTDIKIEVKSKQNYKSEWEQAAFRAVVNKTDL